MSEIEYILKDITDTLRELGEEISSKNSKHGREILDLIKDSFEDKRYFKELIDTLCDKVEEFYENTKGEIL